MDINPSELTNEKVIYRSDKSTVYRLQKNNQSHIVKLISNTHPSSIELASFSYEHELLKKFDSPHIIKCIGYHKIDKRYALVSEDGGISLATFIKNNSNKQLVFLLPLAIQIVKAISEIHSKNIIHKDLNPSNIVIGPTNKIKVIDFGIASKLNQEKQEYFNSNRLEGSLPYISPEQTGRINRDLDYRTDFYSLGVTLFELFTGKRPFNEDNIIGWTHAHIAVSPPQIQELDATFPPVLNTIIHKLLTKNPDERYQSCFGILHDLERCNEELQTGNVSISFTIAEKDINEKFQIPQEVTGRNREIERLVYTYKEALQGNSQLLLLSGYSGIGKSSLVNEAHKHLVHENGFFIKGKFEQFEKNKPYKAISEAFSGLVNALLKESEEYLERWKKRIKKSLKENGQIMTDLIPNLGSIIGEQPPLVSVATQQMQSRLIYTFKQFICTFAKKESPLIWILDDLQWVDLPSLKLIKEILLDDDIQYLYIIGTFRKNEVDKEHPLSEFITSLSSKRSINELELNPLTKEDVSLIISKTLNRESYSIEDLTQKIYKKSGGNPFFLNELLKEIHLQEGFTLTPYGYWDYELDKIDALGVTDNVVDLMIKRINKFSPETREILMCASALGSTFEIDIISNVLKQKPSETFSLLYEAIQENIVYPINTNYRLLVVEQEEQKSLKAVKFKFQHDKVLQACYSQINKKRLQELHNKIAKTLLDIFPSNVIYEQVIDIVKHYNRSLRIITSPLEKLTLCRLNLLAGTKAKEAIAYETALELLKTAEKLLPDNHWSVEIELSEELYLKLSEVYFLNGYLSEGKMYAGVLVQKSTDILKKAKALLMQIPYLFSIEGKLHNCIKTGITALKYLGEDFPLYPDALCVEKEYALLEKNIKGQEISSLKMLQLLKDEKVMIMLQILIEMNAPAYFLGEDYLTRLIMIRLVNITIENGNSIEGAFAYSNFTTICSGFYQDYKKSLEFGQLAITLNEKNNYTTYKNNKYTSKIIFTYTAYVHVWNNPINEAMDLYQKSFDSGLMTGEINYANFAYGRLVYDYAFTSLSEACDTSIKVFGKLNKHKGYISLLCAYRSSMHFFNFAGKTGNRDSLSFHTFDEKECVEYWKLNHDNCGLAGYYLNKIVVLFTYEKEYEIKQILPSLDKTIVALPGLYQNVTYVFYTFLVYLHCFDCSQRDKKAAIKVKLDKMQRWCDHNDINFRQFLLIMKAELYYLDNNPYKAIEKYEEAIQFCREREFTEYRALSKRLLSKLYIKLGKPDLAKYYMSEAFYDYTLWGATRICEFLLEKYGQYIVNLSGENRFALYQTIQASSTTQANEIIDLNAIIKASRMLSGEVSLDKLIDKYIHLIQENAGAERVVILLKNQERWLVEGEIDSRKIALVRKEIPLIEYQEIPSTLFKFVERTRQTIVLNNATVEGNFTEDPYVKQFGPNSILMLPITNMERLTGILFVENRVSPNLFTSKRVEILKLLSAQVAVSIENAVLYNTLEKKVELRTAQLTETNRNLELARREADKANKAKSDFLANMSHEIRTPMNSILGFSEIMLEKEENELNSHYLKSIHTSGTALLAIINDILDLSKVEAGKMRLEYTPLSLESLFQELQILFSQKVKDKGITLELTVSKELPSAILLDEVRLRQILINLIGNAIKFTHSGGVSIKAELQSEDTIFRSTFDLILSVKDTGIGIELNQLEAIFEAFVQADYQKENEYGGTGLGLVITKRLVEMMNGTISVKSQPKQGSEFTVHFKDVEVASANDVILPFEENLELHNIHFQQSHILIADDIHYNRELLKRFLEDYKFTFSEASNGDEVFDKINQQKPDLILLDIKMPQKNGIEVLKELQQSTETNEIPVIVITASVMRESEDQVISLSNSYLRKPISKRELLKEIMLYIPYTEKNNNVSTTLTENFLVPTQEILKEFKKLATGGFLNEIFELSLSLEEENSLYGPFCKQLQNLSRSFLEEEIIDLLNLYMEPQDEYS